MLCFLFNETPSYNTGWFLCITKLIKKKKKHTSDRFILGDNEDNADLL